MTNTDALIKQAAISHDAHVATLWAAVRAAEKAEIVARAAYDKAEELCVSSVQEHETLIDACATLEAAQRAHDAAATGIEVRATWAQASSIIEWSPIGEDDWKATVYQVADASHDPDKALRMVDAWLEAQS